MGEALTMDPRYPIGEFAYTGPHAAAARDALIARIESLPRRLRAVVAPMSDERLDRPYREGGWTARQVIHHIPDSHMHCLLRFKYALAMDGAPILSYPEELWAECADYRTTPIAVALDLLEAFHAKWVCVLRGMSDADFLRAFQHPENGRVTLDRALELYAWHGDHHLAHVELVRG